MVVGVMGRGVWIEGYLNSDWLRVWIDLVWYVVDQMVMTVSVEGKRRVRR